MLDILFEARIVITEEDLLEAENDIEQAVQNLIGHTGATVTCVFVED
jgi:hypothetical protein